MKLQLPHLTWYQALALARRNKGLVVVTWLCLAMLACGKGGVRPNMTTEERLQHAMKLFQDEDYFEARTQFRIITLNAPASTIVDQAQYHLAECHYHLDEFITAASEYEKLLRLYPRSEYLDDSQYKIGLCYYELSPKSDLDQKYTYKAIEEFQKFLDDYPDSEYRDEVSRMLQLARNKIAKKEFNTATLYRRMSYFDSALLYYDEILNRYYDTRYLEASLYYKAEILFKQGRLDKARETLYTLFDRYKQYQLNLDNKSSSDDDLMRPKFQDKAQDLLNQIEQKTATNGDGKK